LTKGLPEKQRYKINIIPCNNTGNLSKRHLPKSKSVEDMDTINKPGLEDEPDSPEKPPKAPGGPVVKELSKTLAEKHITMIANRARNVERKNKKMKSR